MTKYVLIALVSGVISALSQVLLKRASQKKYGNKYKEYINIHVIAGYTLVLVCMALMILAYKGLPFKYGAAMESLVYFYVMILSHFIFE